MVDQEAVNKFLDEIQVHLDKIRELFNTPVEQQKPSIKTIDEIVLPNGLDIKSPDWPLSVPEESIVKTPQQEIARAKMMASKLPNLVGPILDFGCGKGYLTEYLSKEHDIIGYDPYPDVNEWTNKSCSANFFSSWDDITKNGLFKSIILYDVIDHITDEAIPKVVAKIKSVLDKNGTVYVFAHPWTGPHGGHLYEHINKAYAHLLIDKKTLDELYPKRVQCVEILKPQSHYKVMLEDNFTVKSKQAFNQPPNSWVVENLVPILLEKPFNGKVQQDQLIKILSLAGIYYQLTHQ